VASVSEKDIIDPAAAPSLDAAFRERVRRTPEGDAYRWHDRDAKAWRTVSWAEAAAQVERWRAALAAEGLESGDRVAVGLRNAPEWVYLDQAALSLGLVVVPLYTDDRPDSIAYVLADSGTRLLVVQDLPAWRRLSHHVDAASPLARVVALAAGREQDAAHAVDPRVRLLGDWLPAAGAGAPEPLEPQPGRLASIVYTSGTTGRPKGVMLSHGNMLAIAHGSLQMVDCYPDDVFLSFLPLSHTLERTGGYYLPVLAGACVAYARSITQLAEDLRQIRPTVLIAVPRVFERVYGRIRQQVARKPAISRRLFELATATGWKRFERQQGRGGWSPLELLWPLFRRLVAAPVAERLGGRLRVAVSGGAALNTPVARLFIGLGLPVLQGYGLTETAPVVSVNQLEDNEPASVGRPLPGVEVAIGEDSELLVRGPGVMLGYWNNPEATAAMIDPEGWLHTGDQARLQDGRIYITGRIKDILVLSNGEKVPPGDMESAITLDPVFEQALVVGEGHPYLAALVVLNPDEWKTVAASIGVDPDQGLHEKRAHQALLARVSAQLHGFPGYAKVRRIHATLEPWTVDHGLMTPTMKIKRARVLEHYADAIAHMYGEDRMRAAG
jgi:long-chain acyl-CoA synthetase